MLQLGQELKRLRIQKNWTQAAAAKKCSVNPSIFSRIESGKIGNPSSLNLAKIAKGFNVSTESLLSLSQHQESKFRIGFAHCIWAAPVIPLVMDGPPPRGLKLTSYGSFQPADCFDYKPFWYEQDGSSSLYPGPNYDLEHKTLPLGYVRHSDKSKLSAYSAQDLDRLLKNQQLDCVIAAKHVFSSHDSMILHCARIMVQAGGGNSILVWRKDSQFEKSLSQFRDSYYIVIGKLGEALQEHDHKLKTFFGQGTSVEQTFDFFGKASGDRFMKTPVVLRDWDRVLKDLRKCFEEDGAFLFLGWEPLISHIENKFLPDNAVIKTKIHLSVEKPMPYLSFDILFNRQDAKKWINSDIVNRFLKHISLSIEQLRLAITSQSRDAVIVQQIAGYLDLDSAKCLDALSHIDFNLLFYPEWLENKLLLET